MEIRLGVTSAPAFVLTQRNQTRAVVIRVDYVSSLQRGAVVAA